MNLPTFRYRLWKAEKERDRLENTYIKAIGQAKKNRKHPLEEDESEGQLWAEFYLEKDFIDDEIKRLITGQLLIKATRLMLPVPDRNEKDFWEESPIAHNAMYLTPKGVTELRSVIRKEQRESREPVFIWGSFIMTLVANLPASFRRLYDTVGRTATTASSPSVPLPTS